MFKTTYEKNFVETVIFYVIELWPFCTTIYSFLMAYLYLFQQYRHIWQKW